MFTYFQRGMPIKCLGHNRKKVGRQSIETSTCETETMIKRKSYGYQDDYAGLWSKPSELTALREHALRSWCIGPRSWLLIECCPPCLVRSGSKRRKDGANRDWVTAMCCETWRGFSAGVVSFKGTVSGRWHVSLPGACRTLQRHS